MQEDAKQAAPVFAEASGFFHELSCATLRNRTLASTGDDCHNVHGTVSMSTSSSVKGLQSGKECQELGTDVSAPVDVVIRFLHGLRHFMGHLRHRQRRKAAAWLD